MAHFVDRKGQRIGSRKDFDIAGRDFDFTRRHIGVDVFIAPRGNGSAHGNAVFAFERSCGFFDVFRRVGSDEHLRYAVAVAQTDKKDAAQIARAMYPAV